MYVSVYAHMFMLLGLVLLSVLCGPSSVVSDPRCTEN